MIFKTHKNPVGFSKIWLSAKAAMNQKAAKHPAFTRSLTAGVFNFCKENIHPHLFRL